MATKFRHELRSCAAGVKLLWTLPVIIIIALLCITYVDLPLLIWLEAHMMDWYPQRPIVSFITEFGKHTIWFPLSIIALVTAWGLKQLGEGHAFAPLAAPLWKCALLLLLSFAVAGLLVTLMKHGFGRWRPSGYMTEGKYGFPLLYLKLGSGGESFPSGHAQTITVAATALWLCVPRLRWLWVALAFAVCASRVLLSKHFLSDVLVGAYIGVMVTLIIHCVIERRSEKR